MSMSNNMSAYIIKYNKMRVTHSFTGWRFFFFPQKTSPHLPELHGWFFQPYSTKCQITVAHMVFMPQPLDDADSWFLGKTHIVHN